MKRLSIGSRLALGFVVVLILMAGIAAVALFSSAHTRRQLTDTVDRTIAKSAAVTAMRTSLYRQSLLARNIGLTNDPANMQKDMDAIQSAASTYATSEATLVGLGLTSDENALLAEMQQQQAALAPFLKEATEFVAEFNARQASLTLMNNAAPLQEKWLAAIDRLVDTQNREMRAHLDAFEQSSRQANVIILVIALASLVCAALIAFALTRSITRPLREAVGITERVAGGDLNVTIGPQASDETGQLLTALRQMNEGLGRTVQNVRDGTSSIDSASKEIASGNVELSQRTQAQAASLRHTVAAMSDMTTTVHRNADHAIQANQLAASASTLAVAGGQVMAQVEQTMASIQVGSQKVFDIVAVIQSIAFQTNILALNASVEAARAGEQGKGFAVVASEVRTLALRCAGASSEIRQIVQDSAERVQAGTGLVDQAAQTMRDIVDAVQRVDGITGQISQASQEQSRRIEQIRATIAHIDEVSQQNAAGVKQAAASAQSMQDQAAVLKDAVSVFRLPAQTAESL